MPFGTVEKFEPNSLGVARFASPLPHLLEALLAVLNSVVFEVQVRGKLATNHVSQGVMRSCAVPYAVFESADLRAEIAKFLNNGGPAPSSEVALEILIAKTYGLNRDEFAALLAPFNKFSTDEAEALVSKEAWF